MEPNGWVFISCFRIPHLRYKSRWLHLWYTSRNHTHWWCAWQRNNHLLPRLFYSLQSGVLVFNIVLLKFFTIWFPTQELFTKWKEHVMHTNLFRINPESLELGGRPPLALCLPVLLLTGLLTCHTRLLVYPWTHWPSSYPGILHLLFSMPKEFSQPWSGLTLSLPSLLR